MPEFSFLQQSDTLKRAEDQINILSAILAGGHSRLSFPAPLEDQYIAHRNQRFLDIDRKILIGGLLFYLAFSWTDFYLGGDNGPVIFLVRLLLTLSFLFFIWWVPRSSLNEYMVLFAAGGILIAGLSIIAFICMIPGELKYTYHFGLIPIQVFTMVALRLSYRAVMLVSVLLLSCYIATLLVTESRTGQNEIAHLVHFFIPVFILFWLLLIVMGGYMAFMTESAARTDFLKNRLLALEAERLQYLTGKLHYLSTTDALTGIANRRYFEEQAGSEWRRCQRNQAPVSMVMADIDLFKDFNDSYGHQRGDQCLRQVAQTLAAFCQRPGDVCARYGGEEFVLLLPDTQAQEAAALMEKARQAVEDLAVPHQHSPAGVVTVSMGIAALTATDGSSTDCLLSEADRMLYAAKAKGRNRVAVSAATAAPTVVS